ncbi:glycosyltransferase family 2 protein [Hydrogenimonas urashimensis]|uniref:glycosyltransferase family 2 protein n=1 Tax=Hydrogenimonas urashimensis TaxID=2740515 RepID=UPI0019151B19|nr:glycosyltransferase family A protein [Hydrogenimonas urashimensis]
MPERTDPSVSVIIPTYNRRRYLDEAIESVLAQRYEPLELIVVDDGSTDGTQEIVARYPFIRYIYQENAGQAAARNRGIREATGEFLAFLDSDDLWMPGKLRRQVAYLQDHPHVQMLFAHVEQFSTEEHRHLHKAEAGKTLPGLVFGTLLIRREDFLQVGYLQEKWRVGEFVEWFGRATEAGLAFHTLDETLLRRRLHDTNIGLENRAGRNDFARILQERLRKKRARKQEREDHSDENTH